MPTIERTIDTRNMVETYTVRIEQGELLHANLLPTDRAILRDCEGRESVADKLVALELLVRRVEEGKARLAAERAMQEEGATTPRTHDYGPGKRGWGHDYSIRAVHDGGQRLDLAGWGRGIKVGDYIILDNKGDPSRYRIKSIRYEFNPPDQWFAEATFAPRTEAPADGR